MLSVTRYPTSIVLHLARHVERPCHIAPPDVRGHQHVHRAGSQGHWRNLVVLQVHLLVVHLLNDFLSQLYVACFRCNQQAPAPQRAPLPEFLQCQCVHTGLSAPSVWPAIASSLLLIVSKKTVSQLAPAHRGGRLRVLSKPLSAPSVQPAWAGTSRCLHLSKGYPQKHVQTPCKAQICMGLGCNHQVPTHKQSPSDAMWHIWLS